MSSSFPPCAETQDIFSVRWILYGPTCLLATAASFACVTISDWDESDQFERRMAKIVIVILICSSWILLPVFIILDVIKIACLPLGLMIFALTKKYYIAYPYSSTSEIRSRSGSISVPRSSSRINATEVSDQIPDIESNIKINIVHHEV